MIWQSRTNGWLASLAAMAAFSGAVAPCQAEVPNLLDKYYGINVTFVEPGTNLAANRRYLFSPVLGAYTIGPDENLRGMNVVDAAMRQSALPKGEAVLQGITIPYISGPVQGYDQNRIQVKEGLNEAAPDAFRHPERSTPWFSIPEQQVCSADFENAWTFSASVVAPEVSVYGVRLPNQNPLTESVLIGAEKKGFNIVVPSAFGQILLKNNAKALVCKSAEQLRVFNLTGGNNTVMLRLPSGQVVAIGPGSEVVVSKSRSTVGEAAADGIARRGVSPLLSSEEHFLQVNEFSPVSVLRATGLYETLAASQNSRERNICDSVLKTAAAIAMIKGIGGYRHSQDLLADKGKFTDGGNTDSTAAKTQSSVNKIEATTSAQTSSAKDDSDSDAEVALPNLPRRNVLKRCSAVIRHGLRNSVEAIRADKSKSAAIAAESDSSASK